MRVLALLPFAAMALAAAAPEPNDSPRFHKVVKRDATLAERGANMGLIVSTPEQKKAWSKYAKDFDWQINYGSSVGKTARVKSTKFAPMRRKKQSVSTFKRDAGAALKHGARFLLHYNEPVCRDLLALLTLDQNEMGISGKQAARDWKKSMLPLLKKYPHAIGVAGGISANDKGLKFIRDFRRACKNCRAFHWYARNGRSTSDSMSRLKKFTRQVESASGHAKLMVTEYGSRAKKTSDQISLLKKATSFFRSQKYITDIFAFPNLRNGGFTSGKRLTSVGKAYAKLAVAA